jgi:hypothetical protein
MKQQDMHYFCVSIKEWMQHLVESKDLMTMQTELWVHEMLQSWKYVKILLAHNFDSYVSQP